MKFYRQDFERICKAAESLGNFFQIGEEDTTEDSNEMFLFSWDFEFQGSQLMYIGDAKDGYPRTPMTVQEAWKRFNLDFQKIRNPKAMIWNNGTHCGGFSYIFGWVHKDTTTAEELEDAAVPFGG